LCALGDVDCNFKTQETVSFSDNAALHVGKKDEVSLICYMV